MTDEVTEADVYHLSGPGIAVSYRRSDSKLDVSGEGQLARDDLDARETVMLEIGLLVTATLLDSTRNGTRLTLTLLLPDVCWTPDMTEEPAAVTGVATITHDFNGVVGGPPPVLKKYTDARPLEGTASPAD